MGPRAASASSRLYHLFGLNEGTFRCVRPSVRPLIGFGIVAGNGLIAAQRGWVDGIIVMYMNRGFVDFLETCRYKSCKQSIGYVPVSGGPRWSVRPSVLPSHLRLARPSLGRSVGRIRVRSRASEAFPPRRRLP